MKSSELLSEIATVFLKYKNFENQINAILEKIGIFTNVSRVYIFIDNITGEATSNTFEWCNKGIDSYINELQDVSYTGLENLKKIMLKDGFVSFTINSEITEELKQIMITQSVKRAVVYPIYINKKYSGFIGFDECEKENECGQECINLLKMTSGIIVTIYEMKQRENEIEHEKNNFKHFFNILDEMIIICDNFGNIKEVNEKTINVINYSKEELYRKNILDIYKPENRDEMLENFEKVLREEKFIFQKEVLTKNGLEIICEIKSYKGSWNNEKAVFFLYKDIRKEKEALTKFSKIFENNPALMVIGRISDKKYIEVNRAYTEKLGYTREEIIGKTSQELGIFFDTHRERIMEEEIKKYGRIKNMELKIKTKDKKEIFGLLSGEIIEIEGEKYFLTVMVDISEQIRLTRELQKQKKRLKNVIDSTRLGSWEWDIKTGKTVFNQRWAEIMGYRLEEFGETTIKTWENFIHPDDLKISKMLLQKHFSGESDYYSYECRVKHKDGNWRWILDSGRVVEWDKDGLPLIMFGTHQDITEKKILENKIRENSIRDPLTQIYNRRYVFDRMTAIVAEYIRNVYMFSVAIIDIDYFKLINDKYGHQAGDQVLIEFTQIISNGLRPYDILGRYGGEEFIIVSVNTTSEHLKIAIERILEKIRKIEINYKGNKINFTFSTGIADGNDFIEEDLTVDRAVELADRRLYKAKQKGRNRIEI